MDNPHIRRSIGVAVHFFAKRRPKDIEKLELLLTLLSLMLEDKRVYVVKGVGWGLKTIGKYQPMLIKKYLWEKLGNVRISKLMLRKATTYLDKDLTTRLFEQWSSGD
jgi:3-methyladenine DNA glycosylase AlkD